MKRSIESRRLRVEQLEDRRLLSILSAANKFEVTPEWFNVLASEDVGRERVFAPATSLAKSAANANAGIDSLGKAAPELPSWSGQSVGQSGAVLSSNADRTLLSEDFLLLSQQQWIVQLSPQYSEQLQSVAEAAGVLEKHVEGIRVVRGLGLRGLLLVEAKQGYDTNAIEECLSRSALVAYWERNGSIRVDRLPNDPGFPLQWGLDNRGSSGVADADIDAPEAWDITTGSRRVVVAVIDTGIDYTHPDLAANVWLNSGEIPGNGVDDDGNGFVDDVHGYDFANDDPEPLDDAGHGTHVAGIIAGVGNNGTGIAGVNWQVSLLPLKFLDAQGIGATADAVLAINYCTMMRQQFGVNIRVVNGSWGSDTYSQSLYDALKAAAQADILFVVAAGNDSLDVDQDPQYPPAYDLPNLLVAAASNSSDQLAAFSNWGKNTVDLAAPGVGIYSTLTGGRYGTLSGTSMAAPFVTGTAALLWSVAETATMAEVRRAIMEGVDRLAQFQDKVASGGRLNAWQALRQLPPVVVESDPVDGGVISTRPTEFTLRFSQAIDPGTVDPEKFVVNGRSADGYSIVAPDTVVFSFATSPVVSQGLQQLVAEEGLVRRFADGMPSRSWQAVFYYDQEPLVVVDVSPDDGAVVDSLPSRLTVVFSEPVDANSVSAADLVLSEGRCVGVELVDQGTVAFRLADLPLEKRVSYSLARGAISDRFGNPGEQFSGSFVIDLPLYERFVYSGPKVPIRDFSTATVSLDVDQALVVADLDVVVAIVHPDVSDLIVDLVAPDGTTVRLYDGSAMGANFPGITFDDEASRSIVGAVGPFSGSYRPGDSLAQFIGTNTLGEWTLQVRDEAAGGGGYVTGFELLLRLDTSRPPVVLDVQPVLPNREAIPPVEVLDVTFSSALDPQSLAGADWCYLISAGADQKLATADDIRLTLQLATAYSGALTVQLTTGQQLQQGLYELVISGNLSDTWGNRLDGNGDGVGGDDFRFSFRVLGGSWYWSVDTPRPLPDLGSVASKIEVPEQLFVADIDVLVNIEHPYVADLDLWLIGPDGTRVELASDVGGEGDNFSWTIFDQQANLSITRAAPPFTGRFKPEGDLQEFVGEFAQGQWTLLVADDAVWDKGRLLNWALGFYETPPHPPQVVEIRPNAFQIEHGAQAVDVLRLYFSSLMDPIALVAEEAWRLRMPGADELFDTADDQLTNVTVTAGDDGRSVELDFGYGVLPPGIYRLEARAQVLTDREGKHLDGNGDGVPGDDFVFEFRVPDAVAYEAEDVPIAIPDRGRVWSVIQVDDSFLLEDLEVQLDIFHTYAADLDIWLTAPDGRRILLAADVGGSGDGFENAVLDDQAAVSITDAAAPFAGVYRPAEPLALLAGQNVKGTWLLEVSDDTALDTGVLKSWRLIAHGPELIPPRITDFAPGQIAAPGVDAITLVFDRPVDTASFSLDLIQEFVGPNGPIEPTGYRWQDAQHLQIVFPPQYSPGNYRLLLLPGVVNRFGLAIDQDGDGLPGSLSDAFELRFAVPWELGQVSWAQQQVTLPAAFRFETLHSGTITVEAVGLPESEFTLSLTVSATGEDFPWQIASLDGQARLDLESTGGSQWLLTIVPVQPAQSGPIELTIANLIERRGTTFLVYGTQGDDSIGVTLGQQATVAINGLAYDVPFDVDRISVDTREGTDALEVVILPTETLPAVSGSLNSLVVKAFDQALELVGFETLGLRTYSTATVQLEALSRVVEQLQVRQTAEDSALLRWGDQSRQIEIAGLFEASLLGSSLEDTAVLTSNLREGQVEIAPSGVSFHSGLLAVTTQAFGQVSVYLPQDGDWLAYLLTDSSGHWRLDATHRYLHARDSDSSFRVFNARWVDVSVASPDSTVKLYGTAADESLVAADNYVAYWSADRRYRFWGAKDLFVTAQAGGFDEAKLYTAWPSAELKVTADYLSLRTPNRYLQLKGFTSTRTENTGKAGVALFYGTPEPDQVLVRFPYVTLSNTAGTHTAVGFARADIYGAVGSDSASLYDTPGDDRLIGTPEYVSVQASSFFARVSQFSTVRAYHVAGGADTAELYDGAGDDLYTATPRYASLKCGEKWIQVTGFASVTFYCHSGWNHVRLYGSDGGELLQAMPGWSVWQNSTGRVEAYGFDRLTAFGSTGEDQAVLFGWQGPDTLIADATGVQFLSNGQLVQLLQFDQVRAWGKGGADRASVELPGFAGLAVSFQENLLSRPQWLQLAQFEYVDASTAVSGLQASVFGSEAIDHVFAEGQLLHLIADQLGIEWSLVGFDPVELRLQSGQDHLERAADVAFTLEVLWV